MRVRRWVVADTHFGHERLVEWGYRPEGFTELILKNCKEIIKDEDLVIHLGDVAIPDGHGAVKHFMDQIPGRKILVMGNHDKRSVTWYMSHGFEFACKACEMGGVLFTHEPRVVVPEHIQFNIHGRLHEGNHREGGHGPKHRLVSMERSNYKPVRVEHMCRKPRKEKADG